VPQVFGIGNTDARVALRARFDCWVQVRGPDEEQLLTRILRAGDVYLAPNRPDLKLFASDAGALEVLVDGKTIPPIGSSGEVLRNVSLNAAALLGGTARRGG
jgi:cytoskeleton protein RodZ